MNKLFTACGEVLTAIRYKMIASAVGTAPIVCTETVNSFEHYAIRMALLFFSE